MHRAPNLIRGCVGSIRPKNAASKWKCATSEPRFVVHASIRMNLRHLGWTDFGLLQKFQQRLGRRLGRGRILAGDEPPVGDDEGFPVLYLFIEPTEALQLVFHEERHNLGEVYRLLLAVGEARHPLALHERPALELDAMEHAGRMADGSDRFAGT